MLILTSKDNIIRLVSNCYVLCNCESHGMLEVNSYNIDINTYNVSQKIFCFLQIDYVCSSFTFIFQRTWVFTRLLEGIMRANRHENGVIRPTAERENCSNSTQDAFIISFFVTLQFHIWHVYYETNRRIEKSIIHR